MDVLDGPDQIGTLCPHLLMSGGFCPIEISHLLGQLDYSAQQIAAGTGSDEAVELVSLLVPGLGAQLEHVILDELTPKQMHQHDHSRWVRHDHVILDVKLLRAGREHA